MVEKKNFFFAVILLLTLTVEYEIKNQPKKMEYAWNYLSWKFKIVVEIKFFFIMLKHFCPRLCVSKGTESKQIFSFESDTADTVLTNIFSITFHGNFFSSLKSICLQQQQHMTTTSACMAWQQHYTVEFASLLQLKSIPIPIPCNSWFRSQKTFCCNAFKLKCSEGAELCVSVRVRACFRVSQERWMCLAMQQCFYFFFFDFSNTMFWIVGVW